MCGRERTGGRGGRLAGEWLEELDGGDWRANRLSAATGCGKKFICITGFKCYSSLVPTNLVGLFNNLKNGEGTRQVSGVQKRADRRARREIGGRVVAGAGWR